MGAALLRAGGGNSPCMPRFRKYKSRFSRSARRSHARLPRRPRAPEESPLTVAVLGAGISGLAVARALLAKGIVTEDEILAALGLKK